MSVQVEDGRGAGDALIREEEHSICDDVEEEKVCKSSNRPSVVITC
jgi:hypothetical protein